MDQVVAQALTLYAKLENVTRAEGAIMRSEPTITTVTFPRAIKVRRPLPRRGIVPAES
jgi:hypothetical protein